MKIEEKINEINIMKNKLDQAIIDLNNEIAPLCDFIVCVEFYPGDGFCLLDVENNIVAYWDCLKEATKDNKLTIDNFNEWSI